MIGGLTIRLGRAEAFQRIVEERIGAEGRLETWPVIARLAQDYLPLGSGVGTFVPMFKIAEPTALLDTTYLNHAHNEFLEVLLTAGLPGLGLLVWAASLFLVQGVRLWRRRGPVDRETLLARLGMIVILLCALASIGDYPLRVPSLAAIFALACLWATPTPARGGARSD